MPELPEVETTCRGIRKVILSTTIDRVVIRQFQLRWAIPKKVASLKKATIHSIDRRAKYILLYTSKGTFIIHLGMSGRLCIVEENTPPQKHDHVDFILDNNQLLRFTDARRFGSILWTENNPLDHHLLAHLGPEPLSPNFDANYLFAHSRKKKKAIKLFIMDQRTVVGVGNIYANEALFAAKILPERPATSLTLFECKTLVKMIQNILKQAITQGGTTLRDFLSPTGKKGYFEQKLLVYGREKQNCFICENRLSSSRLGQRATVCCLTCQT